MNRKPGTPQGEGKNGTVYRGDRVTATTSKGRVTGTVDGFVGGRHQSAIIRGDSGYTYLADTADVEK